MDFDHNNVKRVAEEDRLSSLPDELIHHILSCIDMKSAVQTCLLSSRWELLWTSIPCLNFYSWQFSSLPKFAKFVTNVLSNRNNQIEVSSVKLDFSGAASQVFVRKIVNYAFSHNVQQLTVNSWPKKHHQFPLSLFSSQSLKHFTLSNGRFYISTCITPKTPWDFPSLTSLHLSHINLCDDHTGESVDLFSKCVNLKNLTLKSFDVQAVKVFDIITPQLSDLTLIDGRCSVVINLIAPQLENLTVNKCSIEYLNVPPGLLSLVYRDYKAMKLPKAQFHSLNKVSICLYTYVPYKEEDAHKTINMLQDLHSVRYLTLNWDIIEFISSFPDLLSHNLSPFSNLICLTMDPSVMKDEYKVAMSTEAKNFFLENSPTAIIKLPKEPPTKAMKQKEARAKKKAKVAADTVIHMKELQTLMEKGNMIIQQKEKEKAKAAFENLMDISSKEDIIRSLLDKLPKRERAEMEACYSKQIELTKAQRGCLIKQIVNSEEVCVFEKLLSDYKSASQTPSSSSTSISRPSTSTKNPMP